MQLENIKFEYFFLSEKKNKNKEFRHKVKNLKIAIKMVAKSIFRYDLWNTEAREEDLLAIHCFMPNGNYICFKCPGTTTIFELKEVTNLK